MPIIQSLPTGQDWLIQFMQRLGYQDEEGLCFGISHMGMQAVQLNDLATFNRRLHKLYELSCSGVTIVDVDTKAFLDGVITYQDPEVCREVMDGGEKTYHQETLLSNAIVAPASLLSEAGQLAKIADFSVDDDVGADQPAIFYTHAYVHHQHETKARQCFKALQAENAWQDLHRVSQASAALVTNRDISWLQLAVKHNDIEKAQALLEAKSDVMRDASTLGKDTILELAIDNRYAEMSLLLASYGASADDISQSMLLFTAESSQDTPQQALIKYQKALEKIALIIKCGAEPRYDLVEEYPDNTGALKKTLDTAKAIYELAQRLTPTGEISANRRAAFAKMRIHVLCCDNAAKAETIYNNFIATDNHAQALLALEKNYRCNDPLRGAARNKLHKHVDDFYEASANGNLMNVNALVGLLDDINGTIPAGCCFFAGKPKEDVYVGEIKRLNAEAIGERAVELAWHW
ncbi:unnamed protein product [Sphagnum balticum]